jgi:hypothetical protein
MIGSLLIFFVLPYFKKLISLKETLNIAIFDNHFVRPILSFFFFVIFCLLGYFGAMPAEYPYTGVSQGLTLCYFILLFVLCLD